MKADEIRVGELIRFENKVYRITKRELHGHGKVARTVHMRLKEVTNGDLKEKNFKSDEKVESVQGEHVKMTYSYDEDNFHVFMHSETYEEIRLEKEKVGKQAAFLDPNSEIYVLFVDEQPVSIQWPETLKVKVVSVPAGVKGVDKEAELENGIKVLVPHFVVENDEIVINTEDCSYAERVTKKSLESGGAVPGAGDSAKAEDK